MPPELGRPSLSESTGAPSKKFSPQFDKRSSHTKEDAMAGATDGDFFEDSDRAAAQCRRFEESQHRTTVFHGGGQSADSAALPGHQPNTVDGVFQISGQAESEDAAFEDTGGGPSIENVDASSSEEEELTYNSQGKPLPRSVMKASGDKK